MISLTSPSHETNELFVGRKTLDQRDYKAIQEKLQGYKTSGYYPN